MKMYKRMAKSISVIEKIYSIFQFTIQATATIRPKTMLIITLQETQDLPEHISS